MTRRKRYKQALFWRGFIAKSRQIKDEDEMKEFLFDLSEVKHIQIEHGWTTWVTVSLKDGMHFAESAVKPIESLKSICGRIYSYAVGQYLDYINQVRRQSLKPLNP